MRVITGAIGHETSTFTTVATTWRAIVISDSAI